MCSPLAMYFSFLFFSLAFWPSLSHHPSPVRSWHARHYSPLLTCPRNGQFVVQGTTHDLPGDDPSLAMVRARRGSGAGVPRPGPHEPSFSALQADKLKFHAIQSHHLQPPLSCPSHLDTDSLFLLTSPNPLFHVLCSPPSCTRTCALLPGRPEFRPNLPFKPCSARRP